MSHRRITAAGFTLIELLVAITLFALLSTMLVGGLRFGARLWESTDAGAGPTLDLEMSYSLARRLIAGALPLISGTQTGAETALAFEGTPSSLRLVGAAPAQTFPGGLYEISLDLVPSTGGVNLLLRVRPYWASAPVTIGLPSERREVLLEGAAAGQFAYFGSEPGSTRQSWQSTWVRRDEMPALVALRMAFPPDDRRLWPDMIVAPQVSTLL